MSVNSAFQWTAKSVRAAQLVAEDKKPDRHIARDVGVAERTLERWKLNPEFAGRVNEIIEQTRSAILRKGIADRARRVEVLDDIFGRLLTVIEERAKEHRDNQKARARAAKALKSGGVVEAAENYRLEIPAIGAGGETGLLVRQIKLAANGTQIEEFAVDTGLLKELRAHQEQAAKELGQWTERRELTGSVEITDARDRVKSKLASIAERAGQGRVPGEPDKPGS